jgi:predicted permease
MRAIFDVILPVFGIILTGYFSGRIKLLGPDSSDALNKFCYWFGDNICKYWFMLGLV